MGHTSGLAQGFMIIGIIILFCGLFWPPLSLKLAFTALKAKKKRWAAFFFFWFAFQLAFPVGLIVWFVV